MANLSAEQLIDDISDAASQVKEQASRFGRAASRTADDTRGFTADTMHETAKSVRHHGQASGDAIKDMADEAADRFDSGARYVRAHDFRGMARDFVRGNPGLSLLAAVAAGFVIATALSGRRS